MSEKNSLFWSEFSEVCTGNRGLNNSQLAWELLEIFRKFHDNNIAIEVSSDWKNREVVLCWWHSKANVIFIDKLLSNKTEIKNYKIIWPKPAMGFDFTLSTADFEIDGSKISFLPLRSADSNGLGVSLFIEWVSELNEWILWKIIETWIGEIAASNISHLRLDRECDSDYLGIDQLKDYVNWFMKNTLQV